MRYFVSKRWRTAGLIVALLFVCAPVIAKDATDPFRDELWYLDTISAPGAWETATGDDSVIVAVLDAGFDLDHEDLESQYWVNTNETAGDNTDNDRNGYEDDVHGWDFVDNDPDPSSDITNETTDTVASHGTVIAGIIGAAANNGLGITGINWDVSIMPLRVLSETGSGSTANVRRAIRYAVENGADVINLSVTFTQTDERLRETIEWAHDQGVVIVAAVGNGGTDTNSTLVYPACFDVELGRNLVIGVASTNKLDQTSDFSNTGANCTDIAAPGEDIFASVYHDPSDLFYITAYASPWEGTSLATPMVSGAAALLRSAYPALTPDQIRNALKLSVDPVQESDLVSRKQLGAGRLNIERALAYAQTFATGGVTTTRSVEVDATHTFITTQGRGSAPVVQRVDARGHLIAEFSAYNDQFFGGVRIATGDVDGDGEAEIVTGAGPSGGPQVRVFNLDGSVESQFFAFDETNRHGIFVSVGDVNADGVEEILVTEDKGGTGQVRVFDKQGNLRGSFFPHGRTQEAIRIAVGQMDDDDALEIISTTLDNNQAQVAIHDASGRYLQSFSTSVGGSTSTSVASADLNGDGIEEVLVGSGRGNMPEVAVYTKNGSLEYAFFPFPLEFRGGVEIAVGDIDVNGRPEIYVTPQTAGGPQIRIFDNERSLLGSFFTFESSNRYGGYIAIQ
jgi:subtilisin family serine protease